ncbi:hypothetical protein PS673_02927 [Pseudomonas fluorescens]|uniref:Phage protein n=1 Tax=Pseudomonas fluorescens TaxID=294 RepID=A0A5E6TXJ6_PSEFL|nr:hypothetical protein [Pseudomonas fluorescens]VVM93815.1 hypothetical protein PS673_02927 [Pseudomonas fluorescens]
MSKTLHGTTTIILDGEDYQLMPTLAAVRSIEAHFGGLRGAAQAINALSVDGCAAIVAAGAGLTGKEAEALPQKVWEAGVLEVSITLNNYLVALYKPRGSESGKIQERKE